MISNIFLGIEVSLLTICKIFCMDESKAVIRIDQATRTLREPSGDANLGNPIPQDLLDPVEQSPEDLFVFFSERFHLRRGIGGLEFLEGLEIYVFNGFYVEFLVLPHGLHGELVNGIEKVEHLHPFRLEDFHVRVQRNGFAACPENKVDFLLVRLGPFDVFVE